MKKFNANWYCCGKYDILSPYTQGDVIYSNGRYKTKLTKEDMPDWYIYGQYYKDFGYMNCKVKDLLFIPSKVSNHMFKDCFLLISYGEPIRQKLGLQFIPYSFDELVYGNTIIDFLVGCEKYGYDIGDIKKQIDEHIQWVKEKDECGYAITYNSFDELVERKKTN